MEKVDIVVVGAGPGGSSFARKASEAGLKVVVLEKRSAVGEPVRCGEAIGEDALNPFKLKPSRRFLAQETNSTSFFSPKGKKQNTRAFGKGFIVERISFDKELSAFASSAGARIMTRTRATGARREGKKVFVKASRFGKNLDFECSLLVAADGIESRVANWFGIKTNYPPSELASCTQVELAGIKLEKQDEIQLYLGSICPGGYVWVFPKGKDRANVGLGLPISHVKEKPALD